MSLTRKQKIIRILTPVLLPLLKTYWKICHPKSTGAKIIVSFGENFLFVRNSYGQKRWNFPGGKVEKGENPEEAALREAREEIGIDIKDVKYIGNIVSTYEGKVDTIHIFHAKSQSEQIFPDKFEIEETRWFAEKDLPKLGPTAQKIWDKFKLYKKNEL